MTTSNEATLFFDGACAPVNPGGVATGGYLIVVDGQTVAENCREFARGEGATNNLAEWSALELGLTYLLDNPQVIEGKALSICGDSQLVIYRLIGKYKCNKPHLKIKLESCKAIIAKLSCEKWSAAWVSRDQNSQADNLSKRAYEQATGRKFPEGF